MASPTPPAEPVGCISAAEARRRGNFYLLVALGDALYVTDLELVTNKGRFWRAIVAQADTRKRVGELHIDAQTGEKMTWYPDD